MTEGISAPSLDWSLDYYEAINKEILSSLATEQSGIGGLTREVVAVGRRIRAILCVLWCEALSGDFRPAVPIAAAYEFAHTAALVEDDVIDGSQSKLGKETVPIRYGVPKAVLLSNNLLFHSPTLIARYSKDGEDPLVVAKLLELLGGCGRLAAKGEFMDLEIAKQPVVTESQYLEMVEMKTGALIGASSASGALIGCRRVENKVIDAAYTFGESLGIAYQIRDDLQDYFGAEIVTGKTAFRDLKNGKKSLPLIHCLKFASEDERIFINSFIADTNAIDRSSEERIRAILSKYGSDDYCREAALKFVDRAKSALSVIKEDSRAKKRLFEVVEYLSSSG